MGGDYTKSIWRDARAVAALKDLLADPDKPTSSQMADEMSRRFGVRISRCAVIGKTRRLGLNLPNDLLGGVAKRQSRESRSDCDPPIRSARTTSQRDGRKNTRGNATRLLAMLNGSDPGLEEPPVIDDHAIPIGQRRTLLELEPSHCRWPVGHPGEEGFFFCGGKAVEERPYCAAHCRIAYETPMQQFLRRRKLRRTRKAEARRRTVKERAA